LPRKIKKLKKKLFSFQSSKTKSKKISPNANHIILDIFFEQAFPQSLEKVGFWKKMGEKALREGNFTILASSFHKFCPSGVSGFWLLSESHLSFHTWPEQKYLTLDIFTCGDWERTKKTERLIEKEIKRLGGKAFLRKRIKRGFTFQPLKN